MKRPKKTRKESSLEEMDAIVPLAAIKSAGLISEVQGHLFMPNYDYLCEANGQIVEVQHGINIKLTTWGQVCEYAAMDSAETRPDAPVRKVLSPPALVTSAGNSDLKNHGFTKLVKRDAGVYENVTATDGESRYVMAGNPATMPHLHKKITD